LVVDVGGTYVKLLRSFRDEREFPSGPRLKPQQLIAKLKETARGWKFDRASIGFPARCARAESQKPQALGQGMDSFQFCRGLGIPVRVVNDAALQALGSYRGGQMLFLGIGTGLGSALTWDNILMPLELGDLPYRQGHIIENYLGILGLALLGEKKWKREVAYAVTQLRKSFVADYVVLGGGLVHRFARLPEGTQRGQNENAFLGGIRLWETKKHSREPRWLVLSHAISTSNVCYRGEVPGRGLEPLRISPPDPKSGASANFATLANITKCETYKENEIGAKKVIDDGLTVLPNLGI
jgi:hypothetical protein